MQSTQSTTPQLIWCCTKCVCVYYLTRWPQPVSYEDHTKWSVLCCFVAQQGISAKQTTQIQTTTNTGERWSPTLCVTHKDMKPKGHWHCDLMDCTVQSTSALLLLLLFLLLLAVILLLLLLLLMVHSTALTAFDMCNSCRCCCCRRCSCSSGLCFRWCKAYTALLSAVCMCSCTVLSAVVSVYYSCINPSSVTDFTETLSSSSTITLISRATKALCTASSNATMHQVQYVLMVV
jgi:hypothetical protein